MITDLLSTAFPIPIANSNIHHSTNQDPPDRAMSFPVISGYLYKLGTKLMFKSWTKRYVELYDNTITYYNSKESSVPLGEIQLSSRIIFEDSSLRHFCFCLTDTVTKVSYYFAAETIADKEAWTDKIRIGLLHAKMLSSRRARSQANSITSVTNQIEARKEYQNRPQLFIKIIKARNLADKDIGGTSDPYVNVYVGSSAVKTTVQKKTLNPEWGMVFNFDMHRSYRYAKIEIWDKDFASSDDFLGMALIPLLPLRDGSSFRNWYPLGKRSSKSSVRGEVEIEISCSGDPDKNHYSWHFFRIVRSLPEFRFELLSNGVLDNLEDVCDDDVTERDGEIGSNRKEGFPLYFPPIETEILEDFSIRVQLSCTTYGSKVFVRGVLLLTNYRLIFITLTRISSGNQSIDSAVSNPLSTGASDLTTQIPLGCIASVSISTENESTTNNAIFEVIKIKTTDHRNISFVLRDDIEFINNPWSTTTGIPDGFHVVDKRKRTSTTISNHTVSSSYTRSNRSDTTATSNIVNMKPFDGSDQSDTSSSYLTCYSADSNDIGNNTSMPSSRRSSMYTLNSLERAWANLISEPSYIVDQSDSDEGSPFARIYARLNQFVINRHSEQFRMAIIHTDLLNTLRPQTMRYIRSSMLPQQAHKGDLSVNNRRSGQDGGIGDVSERFMVSANEDFSAPDHSVPPEDEVPAELPLGWSKESQELSNATPQSDVELAERNATIVSYKERMRELPTATLRSLQKVFDDGWNIYDAKKEYERLGVGSDNLWKFTDMNASYELCSTYPSVLVVPSSADPEMITGSASFRSKGRFPVMVWRHAKNKCTISRCSQPLVGISQNRSIHDESLIACINNAGGMRARERQASSLDSSSSGKPLVIMDARPYMNATANQAAGKGYESEKNYENATIVFNDIANIHAVRKSLEMLEDACADEAHWLKNLDASGWFSILLKILRAATKIVHSIAFEDKSVLVHCSDGWDRTAQLTSMSMLMLDPYYRTLQGFIVLIEKEWISFGHKFGDRLGWTAKGFKDEERSSVFQQFIECVFQCLSQSPQVYEFNEDFLILLMDQAHSGWFGNFLYNCEKDRKECKVELTSISLWTYVLQQIDRFTNKSYQPSTMTLPIIPVTTKHRMVVWSRWYFRWHERIWISKWLQTVSNISSTTNEEGDNMIGMELQMVDGEQTFVVSTGSQPWADDKSAKSCRRCSKQFNMFRRKHHCRSCGQIFCEQCCSEQRIINAVSNWRTSRTCVDCAQKIDAAEAANNIPSPEPIAARRRTNISINPIHMTNAIDDESSNKNDLNEMEIHKVYENSETTRQDQHDPMINYDSPNISNRKPFDMDDKKRDRRISQKRVSFKNTNTDELFYLNGVGPFRRENDGTIYLVKRRTLSFSSFDTLAAEQYAIDHSNDNRASKDEANTDGLSKNSFRSNPPIASIPVRSISADPMKKTVSRKIKHQFSPMTSVAQYQKKSNRNIRDLQIRSLTPPDRKSKTFLASEIVSHHDINTNGDAITKTKGKSSRYSADWDSWDTYDETGYL